MWAVKGCLGCKFTPILTPDMKVTIENHNGRLRLRWLFEGKRYTLGCGVPANPTGMAIAKIKKAEIERDLLNGYFDPTLLRYKPRTLSKNGTEISVPELFKRFTQAMQREKNLAAGSLRRYSCVQAHLQKQLDVPAPTVSERKAGNFAAYLLEQTSAVTAKSYLYLLSACWDWAKGEYHIAPDNPWTPQVQRIKPQPRQKLKPFTTAEARAILVGFKSDRYYRHYYPFVAFLFGTGCRIGEAAGLKWKHLSENFQTVWIGESVSRGTRKSTKTRKARTILLGSAVQSMLKELYMLVRPQPEDLVFPAPKGGPISDRLFNRRAWRKVLEKLNIPYRKPYGMRHTAISHALANGAHHIQVAEQTGHDPRVLYQSYASVIEQKSVFVEF
uniref:Integrase family protein n=1 Tax=Cyanothece sp. (strain PCC 7425 / ATCC 29141) TaxID=395961 RepID=B8HUB1_CYAP4